MGRKYTHEQKLQYLKDGYEFVRSGNGSESRKASFRYLACPTK